MNFRSVLSKSSGVDSRGTRAPLELGGSLKVQSLISAYRSLAITASTFGFEKAIYGAEKSLFLVMAAHKNCSKFKCGQIGKQYFEIWIVFYYMTRKSK